MDAIDLAMLKLLQKNARISLSEISGQINLSLPSVSERLRKLERSGVIEGYTVKLNPDKFGRNLWCYCFIVMKDKNAHSDDAFLQFIAGEPDILECHCITGDYEYLLKIATKSTKELERLLARLREQFPVVRSNTVTVLSTIKDADWCLPE